MRQAPPFPAVSFPFARLLFAGLALSSSLVMGAAEPTQSGSDDRFNIRGIFEALLPNTEDKYTLRVTLRPHVGDLVRKDTLRLPIGFRYGLSDRLEGRIEFESYFSHGLGDVDFGKQVGFSEIRLATKYHLRSFPIARWDTAVGFEYLRPVSHPPRELADGYEHYIPYITFAHQLESLPDLRVFWGLSSDIVSSTSISPIRGWNDLGADNQKIGGGFLWERGRIAYTFEAAYATTRFNDAEDRDLITLRPGIIWQIPRKYTFEVGGQWQVGLGLRTVFGPDETDIGAQARVKIDFDFKKWWAGVRSSDR
ncbi:hypothetical protein MASR2M8_24800 [Opitutaceae bacterium]